VHHASIMSTITGSNPKVMRNPSGYKNVANYLAYCYYGPSNALVLKGLKNLWRVDCISDFCAHGADTHRKIVIIARNTRAAQVIARLKADSLLHDRAIGARCAATAIKDFGWA